MAKTKDVNAKTETKMRGAKPSTTRGAQRGVRYGGAVCAPSTTKGSTNKLESFQKLVVRANKKGAQSVQESIPYKRVYEDTNTNGGVIEVENGLFTKSYVLGDTNYSDAGEEKQEQILQIFEKILNSFAINTHYEITLNNRTIDQEEFNKRVLIEYQNDKYDKIRAEQNELILDKMQEGKNNTRVEKYITVGVPAENIKEAMEYFGDVERELDIKIKKINGRGLNGMVLSLKDRLEILHDIYNVGKEGSFAGMYNLNTIMSQGITTKDIIGPSYMNFSKADYIQIDDKFARTLYLKALPEKLSSSVLESLMRVATNIVLSVHYEIQPQDKAVSFASAQVTNIGGEVVKAQKNLSKSGASGDLISPKLNTAYNDSRFLLDALTNGSQSLFHVTVVATVFADTKEDLDLYTEQFKTRAKDVLCTMDILRMQQEQGFNSCLPLANNVIEAHRIMTTSAAAALQPFSTQELQIKGGFYYGLNQHSKNLIIYNRGIARNRNGVILGKPGGGKSFAAKMEMLQAYLSGEDCQIYIIDPEREYVSLGKELDATIIKIQPDTTGEGPRLNPLDLDITKGDEGDPVSEKIDFVISLVETMTGGRNELNGYAKSIIDNTLQSLYAPYIAELTKTGKTIDTSICPTLADFYDALKARREPEAQNLAMSIQMYCKGSLNLFASRTNIDTNNRMVIYDTKHIGSNLQELGMQICLNDIWNRMISNKAKNIRTYFYVDEFYLLLRQLSAAKYLEMIWKRARKWQGVPTGITQNVSDLIHSEQGNTILKTSDFALIMPQAFEDRYALATIFQISDELQQYITDGAGNTSGEGLIYTSSSIVPFENHIPNTSPIYKILSTKAEDDESAVELVR